MIKTLFTSTLFCLLFIVSYSQNYGDYPKIEKEALLKDLEILYQGLDQFHSGMYWYTSKDSVDLAFTQAKQKITQAMNVVEFYKLIAPLVALSREGHTQLSLPKNAKDSMIENATFLPMTFLFLDHKLYCLNNGSSYLDQPIEGKEIELINGESPLTIVTKIGSLIPEDGYIKPVIFSDLNNFNFAIYYYYYYGNVSRFEIKFKEIEHPIELQPLTIKNLREHIVSRLDTTKTNVRKDLLEFQLLNNSTAYIGVHSFSNSDIKKYSKEKSIADFFKNSFQSISANGIQNLIIDVSQNGGGTEGNEGLLYSYLGENYQKYIKVSAKTQRAILDNGNDEPIKLKTFGFVERIAVNKKMKDGSLERRKWIGYGLMAYKKKPKHSFNGKLYVLISPTTYSGGSEFCNMIYTNELATFVGEETGGGYYGNTSGYSKEITLPHSKIDVDLPALRFIMNVKPKLPFGSGVLPDYKVIPTFEQYLNGENPPLTFILEQLVK